MHTFQRALWIIGISYSILLHHQIYKMMMQIDTKILSNVSDSNKSKELS